MSVPVYTQECLSAYTYMGGGRDPSIILLSHLHLCIYTYLLKYACVYLICIYRYTQIEPLKYITHIICMGISIYIRITIHTSIYTHI